MQAATAVFAFEGAEEGQLCVSQGDALTVEWQSTDGWVYACASDGVWGLLPRDYISVQAELPAGWNFVPRGESNAEYYIDPDGQSQWEDPRLPIRQFDEAPNPGDDNDAPPDDDDDASVLSGGSFTTIASATSGVRRGGDFGQALRRDLAAPLATARAGEAPHMPLAALHLVQEEEELTMEVGPSDSISNVGSERTYRTGLAPSAFGGLAGSRRESLRIKATDGHNGAPLKIIRPESVARLREVVCAKASLLWPAAPWAAVGEAGPVVGSVQDDEGCEVFEENYELVADGALIYVRLASVAGTSAGASSGTPSSQLSAPRVWPRDRRFKTASRSTVRHRGATSG